MMHIYVRYDLFILKQRVVIFMYHFLQLTHATNIIAKYLLHTDFNVIRGYYDIDSMRNIASKI